MTALGIGAEVATIVGVLLATVTVTVRVILYLRVNAERLGALTEKVSGLSDKVDRIEATINGKNVR